MQPFRQALLTTVPFNNNTGRPPKVSSRAASKEAAYEVATIEAPHGDAGLDSHSMMDFDCQPTNSPKVQVSGHLQLSCDHQDH